MIKVFRPVLAFIILAMLLPAMLVPAKAANYAPTTSDWVDWETGQLPKLSITGCGDNIGVVVAAVDDTTNNGSGEKTLHYDVYIGYNLTSGIFNLTLSMKDVTAFAVSEDVIFGDTKTLGSSAPGNDGFYSTFNGTAVTFDATKTTADNNAAQIKVSWTENSSTKEAYVRFQTTSFYTVDVKTTGGSAYLSTVSSIAETLKTQAYTNGKEVISTTPLTGYKSTRVINKDKYSRLAIKPDTGYYISSVKINGVEKVTDTSTVIPTSVSDTSFSYIMFGSDTLFRYVEVEFAKYVTVTYNGNSNTSGSVPTDNSNYKSGAEVTVLDKTNDLKKTGYTFAGWNTQANGSGTNYPVGDKFTINSDIILYAQWTLDPISVTGVTLNKPSTILTVGDSEALTATVAPSNATNQSVTWSTSNSSVAKVINGVVTAEGEGTATITVITQDGEYKATCAVTVTATTPPVTTHTVTVVNGTTNGSGSGNYAPGATVTITANAPASGYQFLNWTASPTMTLTNNSTTTFTMPAHAVTVEANYEQIPVPTYAVTVVNGTTNGLSSSNYTQSATVTITASAPPEGQQFKNWTASAGVTFADANTATTTFTMPGNAVTVTANYEPIPATTYAVTVTNGTGGGNYAQGVVVNITANAAPDGQRFLNWTTTSAGVTFASANNSTTSFIMPANAVTITANYILLSETTEVTYTAVQVGGTSETVDSTGIKITFNQAVTGLTLSDITVTNGTGAVVQGTLTGSGTTYTVALSSITTQGKVTVSIGNFGIYTVKTAPLSVDVYKNASSSGGNFKYGDLSGKGYVDNTDLILLLRYFMQPNLSIDLNAADVNGDGFINNLDLILLLRYFARPGIVLGPQ